MGKISAFVSAMGPAARLRRATGSLGLADHKIVGLGDPVPALYNNV